MIEKRPVNEHNVNDQKMWSGFWWGLILGGLVAFLRGPRVDVKGTAQETIEGTRERFSDATQTVRSAAEETIEGTRERISGATDAIRETVQETVEGTRERISEATHAVRDTAQDAIDGTRERFNEATGSIRESIESFKPVDTLKDSIDFGKEAAHKRKTELDSPSEMGSPSDVD